jgi:hypothetical protein
MDIVQKLYEDLCERIAVTEVAIPRNEKQLSDMKIMLAAIETIADERGVLLLPTLEFDDNEF